MPCSHSLSGGTGNLRPARELQRGNKGWLHLLKCQVEKLSYDVSSAVEDLMMFVDSGYSLGRKSGQER